MQKKYSTPHCFEALCTEEQREKQIIELKLEAARSFIPAGIMKECGVKRQTAESASEEEMKQKRLKKVAEIKNSLEGINGEKLTKHTDSSVSTEESKDTSKECDLIDE